MRQARVDYDAIAHLYDATPYRVKPVDPEFTSFVKQFPADELAALDIGCGTTTPVRRSTDRAANYATIVAFAISAGPSLHVS